MDTGLQRLPCFKLGILDARRVQSSADVAAVAEWIARDRIAILTGFFSRDWDLMSQLFSMSGATFQTPMYQEMAIKSRSRGWQYLYHPTYFVLYGFYKAIRWPSGETRLPDYWQLGEDVRNDMVPVDRIPAWLRNDEGSAFVPNHGQVKMKPVDFARWFTHAFQTCVWIGTSTPSKQSRQRQLGRGVLE